MLCGGGGRFGRAEMCGRWSFLVYGWKCKVGGTGLCSNEHVWRVEMACVWVEMCVGAACLCMGKKVG